jgi:hypothetical protein
MSMSTLHRDESGGTPQPDRRHRESRLRQILRAYKFEIIWLAIVALGFFLIFERMNIRSSLFEWLGRASAVLLTGVGRFDDQFGAFLTRITLSDTIGLALVLGAIVAIALRVRWRLIRNPALAHQRCPQCNGNIYRVHRHAVDRLISLYVPVQRYRCANDQCRWHGRGVSVGHGSGRSSSHRRS